MTADAVSWSCPAPGAYSRTLRFGEWIFEPVTPLFESWLLPAMEDRLHDALRRWVGQHAPRPFHVLVNGWYFYSINFISPRAMARSLPDIVWHLLRSPRRVAGVLPPTVRHSIPVFERDWREDIQPRYRAAVAGADRRLDALPVGELPALVDGLAASAGEYFASIAALAGAAYKMEINLASFRRRHLPGLGGSHLSLLAGLEAPLDPAGHAVASLDWWFPPVAEGATAAPRPGAHERLVATREAAEQAAFDALGNSPRRLRAFRRLLADAQHVVPIREEQVRELTIAWPVMRRGIVRIGDSLVERGLISISDDVFFLTYPEVRAAMRGDGLPPNVDVPARRRTRIEQTRLAPPLMVGRADPMALRFWDRYAGLLGAMPSDRALVSGIPASAGRATGVVRVVMGPADFGQLLSGEILVAPLTAPAWTPLFTRAAAVVTDIGGPAAHASIIAREYGIPAVVGCGDATSRLRTGMRVTVDGNSGNVEPG